MTLRHVARLSLLLLRLVLYVAMVIVATRVRRHQRKAKAWWLEWR